MSKKKWKIITIFLVLLVLGYWVIPRPEVLGNFTFSSAVYDRNDRLLRLTLSRDEKFRLFVQEDEIPEDFKKALILYEDRNFYYHFGVDPKGLIRAAVNMASGARKQGASTITMQLARLAYNIDSTTIWGKIYQIVKAIQIERHYSKDEILEAYFNLSPYGNNVEGIGAASLIYFGTDVSRVSLPEILALTVVPQNPGGRNPSSVSGFENMMKAQKRLASIWIEEFPDDENNDYLKLPIKVRNKSELPFLAPHFTTGILQKHWGTVKTTLDTNVQLRLEDIAKDYVRRNKFKGINNTAVFLINYETMEVVAQIGSADFFNDEILGQVDGTNAKRSPGSAMKPFIYALALEKGLIHPLSIIKDLPKSYAFYNPENFDNRYQGILTATSALVFSRNIPAVELQQQVGTSVYYKLLKDAGVTRLKGEEYYGLALALGGFEVSLQEMARMYAMMANGGELREINVLTTQIGTPHQLSNQAKLGESLPLPQGARLLIPEASFLALDMLSYNKPTNSFKPKVPVYWKTGTSYSYKDAVSVGVFGPYILAVWIGNFDGTPNHSFVGRSIAAPLFFEIVGALEKDLPVREYVSAKDLNVAKVDICRATGDIANALCPQTLKGWFIPGVSPIKMSNIHREVPVDVSSGLRACRHTPPTTVLKVFEFWPSDIMQAFNAAGVYKKLPPDFAEDCREGFYRKMDGNAPNIIYPVQNIIYMIRPHRLNEEKIILKASVDADAREVYWFMNDALLGKSKPGENFEAEAKVGEFTIKAVDDLGRSAVRKIVVKLSD